MLEQNMRPIPDERVDILDDHFDLLQATLLKMCVGSMDHPVIHDRWHRLELLEVHLFRIAQLNIKRLFQGLVVEGLVQHPHLQ